MADLSEHLTTDDTNQILDDFLLTKNLTRYTVPLLSEYLLLHKSEYTAYVYERGRVDERAEK